jgi:hypothetical protein
MALGVTEEVGLACKGGDVEGVEEVFCANGGEGGGGWRGRG